MPDLDFGDTDEEAILVLKGFAHRVNNDLYNHGQKGLVTMFNTFVTAHATREEEQLKMQEARHRANSVKLNIVMALIALGTLIVAITSIIVTAYFSRHAGMTPLDLLHSSVTNPVLSRAQQISTIPPLTR